MCVRVHLCVQPQRGYLVYNIQLINKGIAAVCHLEQGLSQSLSVLHGIDEQCTIFFLFPIKFKLSLETSRSVIYKETASFLIAIPTIFLFIKKQTFLVLYFKQKNI